MKIKLDHINLTVHDIKESIDWYEKIFGFKLAERGIGTRGQSWAIVASNDSMIAMSEYKDKSKADQESEVDFHKIYHFGIRVSDLAAWEKIVKENDLRIYYGGVVSYPFSRSWYIHDPSGHEIEVSYSEQEFLQFPNRGA
ncbi:MAG: VOC family protein [Bdellovibrionota bacterium]